MLWLWINVLPHSQSVFTVKSGGCQAATSLCFLLGLDINHHYHYIILYKSIGLFM